MEAKRYSKLGTAPHWMGLIAAPLSVWGGLIAHAALAPGYRLSAELAAWMVIFVTTVLPVHLIAYAITFALMRDRLRLKYPSLIVALFTVIAAVGIAFSRGDNPFQAVFGAWYTPCFVIAYAVAAGRSRSGHADGSHQAWHLHQTDKRKTGARPT